MGRGLKYLALSLTLCFDYGYGLATPLLAAGLLACQN